jgi:Ca2+-binding RTX toxin-like protein
MLARTRTLTVAASLVLGALLPASASAALDVTRNAATGGFSVAASGDVAERVTLDRAGDGSLRIADAAGPVTSSDAACTADPATGTVSCATTSGMAVTVALGGGADTLDARSATGIALSVDAGAGADRLRLGASGMATATGTDRLDTFDLTHADASVRVRYEKAARRVVARCGGCSGAWAVTLPVNPKAVLLGTGDDDIDLRAWTVRGLTSWTTGAGRDRAIGSRYRRSVFNTGADPDVLLSWAPADTLLAGAGADKLADLGGSGDILDGGADIDVMASLDRGRDTMRGGAGRDMCPSLRMQMSTCDTSGRVSGFEMNLYLPVPTQTSVLRVVGIFL